MAVIPFAFMRHKEPKELEKELQAAAEEFYNLNIAGRKNIEVNILGISCDRNPIEMLNVWCEAHLGCSYEDVACALPEKIKDFKGKLDKDGITDIISKGKEALKKQKGGASLTVKEQQNLNAYNKIQGGDIEYVVTTLYNHMKPKAQDYLMKWMEERGIVTCPYCNHNYILYDNRSDDGQGKLNTAQLDHYYPKAKYPILAASFFNLIPSCPNCNHVKGEKPLAFSPYDKSRSHEDIMNFRYWLFGLGKTDENNLLELVGEKGFQGDVKTLRLDALYRKHQNLAVEIERKLTIFGDDYIDRLAEEFHLEPSALKDLLFGVRLTPDEFSQRPLSKFTHDILKSLK